MDPEPRRKIIKVITEFEVPEDFNDSEELAQWINASIDCGGVDDFLPEDVDVGLTYGEDAVVIR